MSGIEGWNGLVVDKPLGRKEHAIAAFLHADLVRQLFFVEAARGRERKHIDSDEDGASVGGLIHYWRAASASERPFKPRGKISIWSAKSWLLSGKEQTAH
ncbi:MAG: hypothetical protein WAL37_16555 [Xanthobacteraceae bacterium]